MSTLRQIDPHAFRREGVHPSLASRWSEICDCDLHELPDSIVSHLIEAGIGTDQLIPIALRRLDEMTQLFRSQPADALINAVIAAPARFWIGKEVEIQLVANIARRLNYEMGQHRYVILTEASVRDSLFRIANCKANNAVNQIPFPDSDAERTCDGRGEPRRPGWAVWRQDDSGSKFLIEANLTEQQARAIVADFEAKGHKQTYWCSNQTIA